MKTLIINLYGGPGSGKSTIAAGVYFELKKKGINAELVREYVKKWAWEGRLPNRLDQLYITGKQTKAEHMLYGKVKVIITDCPVLMGVFYDKKYNNLDTTKIAVDTFLNETSAITERKHYVVKRSKQYDTSGRFCSENSAMNTDIELLDFLSQTIPSNFLQLEGSIDAQVLKILETIQF